MDIEEYAKKHRHLVHSRIPSLLKSLLLSRKWHSIADLGCGEGSLLYALNKQNLLTNKDVFAVDLSAKRLESVQKINTSFNLIKSDVTNLEDIADSKLDFILTTQVIEHVDDQKFISEIYRVLAKGGTVYLNTVFKGRFAWYFYKNQAGESVLDPTHLREYTKDEQLFKIIEDRGFIIENHKKSKLTYSLVNFFIKKFHLPCSVKEKVKFLDKCLMIPIPNYYIWEIVLRKK